jgi:hypothetical protein
MKSPRKQYVDKKVIRRLYIFAIIFLGMFGFGVYDIFIGNLPVLLGILALFSGIAAGLLVGRAFNVVWHEEAGKAITKMDVFGVIILVAYIAFAIFRRRIFGHWLHGSQLSAFVVFFSAGIMLGRLLTLRMMIIKVLKEQGL